MRLDEAGEFTAITRLSRVCASPGRAVRVGIGDDAAAFRPTPGALTLVTADSLVEGVHFDLAWTSWSDLGYKSLAASLSDIAAMGGVPRFYLVSLALPGDVKVEDVEDLYRGMEALGTRHGVRLIGGDTCASPGPAVISVTVLGEVGPMGVVRRKGARPGDHIYVTGTLGDSSAGLSLLRTAQARRGATGANGQDGAVAFLKGRHLRPTPRLKAGRLLSGIATSMIDISDGFSSDLGHILEQSRVGAEVRGGALPLSKEMAAVFGGDEAALFALHGGEDYELLFTARPAAKDTLKALARRAGTRFTLVGAITDGAGAELVAGDGLSYRLGSGGYEHFRK